jgi:hypothetical protein
MKMSLLLGVVVVAITMFSFVASACEDDEGDGDGETPTAASTEPSGTEPSGEATTVSARLSEYTILPDPASGTAGSVTFEAENVGGTAHELVVIKTDLAMDALPTAADGSVDEGGAGIEVIGEIEEFDAMSSESGTFELEAGAYVLICNVVDEAADGTTTSHYAEGMTVAFPVQ